MNEEQSQSLIDALQGSPSLTDVLQSQCKEQLALLDSYLEDAKKASETDPLMSFDFQMSAKAAAETLEILQRILLLDQLAKSDTQHVRQKIGLPLRLNTSNARL